MTIDHTLSESAFLVNESRARRIDISHDAYAHLWVSNATRRLWNDFTRRVYPYDDIELGLRNRFFLEQVKEYMDSTKNGVFINLGAGFTSYPLLLPTSCLCIELDVPAVIDYKREKIAAFQKEGLMPSRKILFKSTDLENPKDRKEIETFLKMHLRGKSSFIILEGITYYLQRDTLEALFKLCSTIQTNGSRLAFDFWTPSTVSHPVFQRFTRFFSERFHHEPSTYTFLDEESIKKIRGYTITTITDIQQLERIYLTTRILHDYQDILPEQYVVLTRQSR
jgi:O-methyltransferase involved in polyketide biosynthesis